MDTSNIMDSELTALKRSYFRERFRARNSQATQLSLTLALVYVVYTAIGLRNLYHVDQALENTGLTNTVASSL